MSEVDVLAVICQLSVSTPGAIWRELRQRPEYAWSRRMDVVTAAHQLLRGGYVRHVILNTTVRYRITPKGVAFLESITQSSDAT